MDFQGVKGFAFPTQLVDIFLLRAQGMDISLLRGVERMDGWMGGSGEVTKAIEISL